MRMNWVSTTKFVDLETGEIITKRTKKETYEYIKQNYIKIKTTKHATKNEWGTRGTIEFTIGVRRNPQRELPYINE